MMLALLVMLGVLHVALFLVFCRWERILRGMLQDLGRLEKWAHQVANPPASQLQGEGRPRSRHGACPVGPCRAVEGGDAGL